MKAEIIPVIHIVDNAQVIVNINTCVSAGITKVFLINHQDSYHNTIMCADLVKQNYPNLWVGINLLGLSTEEAIQLDLPSIDGLWCDGSIAHEVAKDKRVFKGKLFGGLAFKYQKQPTSIEDACVNAILSTDVATTSGSGTGKPPTRVKIENLRNLLGNHPMAIASGISIDNIDSYKDLVQYFLVASSVTDANEIISVEKLTALKSKLD